MKIKFRLVNIIFLSFCLYTGRINAQEIKYIYDKVGNRVANVVKTIQPQIQTNTQQVWLPANGGTYTLELKNNGKNPLNWNVNNSTDWIHIAPPTSGTNNSSIGFIYDTNYADLRHDTIVIEASGAVNTPYYVFVHQRGENNSPLVANAIDDIERIQGFISHKIDVSGVFSDPDFDNLSYNVYSDDQKVVLASILGETIHVSEKGLGTSSITLVASDNNGDSAKTSFNFSVVDPLNISPVLVSALNPVIRNQGYKSHTINLSEYFNDADVGDILSYAVAIDKPIANVIINGTTLTILENNIGTAVITISASDGRGGYVSTSFDLEVISTVNLAPILENALSDQSVIVGNAYIFTIPENTFSDPNSDELTLSATLNDGSDLPSWLTFDSGTGILSGLPSTSATFIIKIIASDPEGESVSSIFVLTVTEATSITADKVNSIKVFPNPTMGVFMVVAEEQLLRYRLFNSSGDEIKKGGFSGASLELDLSEEPTGIYYIILSSKNNTKTVKIIKQ